MQRAVKATEQIVETRVPLFLIGSGWDRPPKGDAVRPDLLIYGARSVFDVGGYRSRFTRLDN